MYVRRTKNLLIAFATVAATALAVLQPMTTDTAAAASSESLVQTFDDGGSSWVQAQGVVTASTSTSKSEGAAALTLTYDVSGGNAEAERTGGSPLPAAASSALKLDFLGDGTYNTLYLRLRDASGEILMYRVGNLNVKTWTTATISLKSPAAASGGNANGILDTPIAFYRLVVARNGTQPATGSITVDNLRAISDGWGAPTAAPDYFSPSKGEAAAITVPAGTPGDYRLVLTDSAGRARSLTGSAGNGNATLAWNGMADDGTQLVGDVSAVLAYDTTPDGTVTSPTSIGNIRITTVAEVEAPISGESTAVAESFDTAGTSWTQAKGIATPSVSADRTEGAAALKVAYDLTSGAAEAGWSGSAPTFAPVTYSALKLDYKGDGTFNTLYLRMRDSTGEIFYYRVGNLDSTSWANATVNLTAPPAAASGGNANGVLDAPVSLYRVVISRNGTEPATGSVVVDNLRTVGNGWPAPTATPEYFSTASGETAAITVAPNTAGDFALTLRDASGHSRDLTGSATAPEPQTLEWDGKDGNGVPFVGNVSSVLAQDGIADGTLTAPSTLGTPLLTTVAELDTGSGQTVTVTETFDGGDASWVQALGSMTPTTSADKTQGSAALSLAYNFASGTAEAGYKTTPPTWDLKAYSAMKIDYKGDGSFNTLYVRLRDATGEIFLYRTANINAVTWSTATIDLRAAPAGVSGGNNDRVLDAPISLYRISMARNGTQPATGTVTVDNMRAIGDAWGVPTASPAYFSAASGQRTVISVPAATAGDFELTLRDPVGNTRSLKGTSSGAGTKSIAWDGKTAAGVSFQGNVSAALSYDVVPDGVLASATAIGAPYLGGVSARPKATATSSMLGTNSTMTTYEGIGSVDAEAKLMEDAYVRYAREEFEWNRVEPRQDYFEWAKFDQTVAAAKARNVEIIGKLVYTADWASSAPAGTPSSIARYYPAANLADWTDYVQQTVSRYKDSVTVWEVWNEPNIDKYWKPSPNAAQYAELLKASYSTIKTIQPNSTVLLGGLAGFSESYMDGLFAAGAGNSFDGLGLHTYVSGAPEPSIIDSWISAAQTYLARKAPGRLIWITEMGWTTCSACDAMVSEDAQAQYLSRFTIDAASHGIAAVLWFSLRELGDSGNSIDNYGLVERGGRQKPAYAALKRFGMATVQTVASGTANPGSTGKATLIDDLATTSGYTTASLGSGGSSSLRVSTARIGGAGALSLSYNYGVSTATGTVISTAKAVSGSPTSLSLWVYGDNSNNPIYLKFKDATGESFEAKVGNVGTPAWQRLVFYFDGLNPNYTHSGGNNDGVVNYPITVTNLHVYKSTSGVKTGQFLIDDLTAHYGTATRGAVFYGRGYVTQAVYATVARNSSLSVPNTTAYIYDRGTVQGLTVTNTLAAVTLSPAPKFVISTPAAVPVTSLQGAPVTLSLVMGDRSNLTLQVVTKSGALIRTLSVDQSYMSGPRSIIWDGKTSAGAVAAKGSYSFRIQSRGPGGQVSIITRSFDLT